LARDIWTRVVFDKWSLQQNQTGFGILTSGERIRKFGGARYLVSELMDLFGTAVQVHGPTVYLTLIEICNLEIVKFDLLQFYHSAHIMLSVKKISISPIITKRSSISV
jgi:hypothetical protein